MGDLSPACERTCVLIGRAYSAICWCFARRWERITIAVNDMNGREATISDGLSPAVPVRSAALPSARHRPLLPMTRLGTLRWEHSPPCRGVMAI